MEKSKILIIDDEAPILKFLSAGLPASEYEIIEAHSAREGISAVATHNPDLVLLDLGLPDMDGLQVINEIRQWSEIPIIVLSAREQEADKVTALDGGAQDYLTKPFSMAELSARMRAALRLKRLKDRPEVPNFSCESFTVDFPTHTVTRDGKAVHLTPLEFRLLAELIRHAGKVLTHRHLLSKIWGPAYERQTQYLRVFMGQLRHKLERDPAKPRYLTTEPGIGYRFRAEQDLYNEE